MKPQSAKQKGRILQQTVKKLIYNSFPILQEGDVESRSMGASGTDLILSPLARKLFPFSVECKNQESVNVWKSFEQACSNVLKGTYPLLVIKKNRSDILVVLRLTDFLNLISMSTTEEKKV